MWHRVQLELQTGNGNLCSPRKRPTRNSFYKEMDSRRYPGSKWHLFVHVCRGWWQVAIASPLRLDLRILCTSRTPVEKNPVIGQTFIDHLFIDFDDFNDFSDWPDGGDASGEDNVISALEHVDRICDVRLNVTGSELEEISTVMQEPFLALTTLRIVSGDLDAPILAVEFLGGSAPHLQNIYLDSVPFPDYQHLFCLGAPL